MVNFTSTPNIQMDESDVKEHVIEKPENEEQQSQNEEE